MSMYLLWHDILGVYYIDIGFFFFIDDIFRNEQMPIAKLGEFPFEFVPTAANSANLDTFRNAHITPQLSANSFGFGCMVVVFVQCVVRNIRDICANIDLFQRLHYLF